LTADNVSEYDNGVLYPVNLTISNVDGRVDKSSAKFGEEILYAAPSEAAIDNVTASIHGVEYTIKLAIKYQTNFTINNIPDFTEGSSINLTVTELNNYTGQVNVTIGTETYTLDMVNGTGNLTITPNLSPGTYTATIKFNGNTNYTKANATSNNFTINAKPVPPSPTPTPTPAGKQNTKIIAKNKVYKPTKYKTYKITVKNTKGKPVKNTKVKITIGKKTYTSKTNKKGIATFKIPNKKSKKKTWKITATLNKNAKNNKLTLQIESQTNKATTNNKGKATFTIKTSKKKISIYTKNLKTTSGQVVKKQKVNLIVFGKTF
jgi:hypothetical protein